MSSPARAGATAHGGPPLQWCTTMRMTFVLSSLAGGGAERVSVALMSALVARGHHVSLVTLTDPADDVYQTPQGVQRVALSVTGESRHVGAAISRNALAVRRLTSALRGTDPDVVIAFQTTPSILALLAASRRWAVVVSERVDPRAHSLPKPWPWLRDRTYRRAAALVVQTESLRGWAEARVDRARVAVIPNALSLTPSPSSAARAPAGAAGGTIVAVGRLTHQKGHDVLLRAFSRASASVPGWRLTIHGEGEERSVLAALASRLGIAEQVSFPGYTRHVASALAEADLFVLASRYEGFPNALVEAMASGVASIATSCPSGPDEIITSGQDGLLVAVDDVEGLARAMARLMSDATLREIIGAAGRSVAKRYDLDTTTSAWLEVLGVATSGRRTRR